MSDTTQSVGQGDYIVRKGDCLNSIAYKHGFTWKTLWFLPENDELRRERQTPFQLLPGDRVTIIPLRIHEESCETEQKHRFRRKSVPAVVKLKIFDTPQPDDEKDDNSDNLDQEDEEKKGEEVVIEELEEDILEQEPACNMPYHVIIDGKIGTSGKTDEEGMIELSIPPDAREIKINLEPESPNNRIIQVKLGELDPLNSREGQIQRLQNLGFIKSSSVNDDAIFSQAIEEFQKSCNLSPTAKCDQNTLDQLDNEHGS